MNGAVERGRCMWCQLELSDDDRRVCMCVFSYWLGLGQRGKRLYLSINHWGLGAASRLQCALTALCVCVRLLMWNLSFFQILL